MGPKLLLSLLKLARKVRRFSLLFGVSEFLALRIEKTASDMEIHSFTQEVLL